MIPMVAAGLVGFGQVPTDLQGRFLAADLQVVRVKPSALPQLLTHFPKILIPELERRGCTIPQGPNSKVHNVIKGEFAKPGQIDWALICSVNRVSSILVYWNGEPSDPTEIAKMADIHCLAGDGPRTISFSCAIATVGKDYIMKHYTAYGGPKPPPIDHEGIDSSIGMGSVVNYFYKGKWLRLTGAD